MVEVVAAMAPVASQHRSGSCCCCVVSRTEQQHLGILAAFLIERLLTVVEGSLLLSLSLLGMSAVNEDLSLSSNLQCKDAGVDEADINVHITEVGRSDLQVTSGEKEGILEDSRISLIVKARKDAEAPECKDDADSDDDDDDDEDDDDDDEVDDDGDDDDAEEDDEGDAHGGQENNAEDEDDDDDDDQNGNEEDDDDDDDDDDEDDDDDDDEDEDEDEEPPAKKKK